MFRRYATSFLAFIGMSHAAYGGEQPKMQLPPQSTANAPTTKDYQTALDNIIQYLSDHLEVGPTDLKALKACLSRPDTKLNSTQMGILYQRDCILPDAYFGLALKKAPLTLSAQEELGTDPIQTIKLAIACNNNALTITSTELDPAKLIDQFVTRLQNAATAYQNLPGRLHQFIAQNDPANALAANTIGPNDVGRLGNLCDTIIAYRIFSQASQPYTDAAQAIKHFSDQIIVPYMQHPASSAAGVYTAGLKILQPFSRQDLFTEFTALTNNSADLLTQIAGKLRPLGSKPSPTKNSPLEGSNIGADGTTNLDILNRNLSPTSIMRLGRPHQGDQWPPPGLSGNNL